VPVLANRVRSDLKRPFEGNGMRSLNPPRKVLKRISDVTLLYF
jgi:hypothetical protein